MTLALVQGPESSTAEFATPSNAIWGKFPVANLIANPHIGLGKFYFEDFDDFPVPLTNTTGSIKSWRAFLSNGGTLLDAAAANVSAVTALSDDDNEAVVLAKGTASVRIAAGSGRQVCFEARMKVNNITDSKAGQFFGLFTPIEPTATSHIGDDGALVDSNYIGFHKLEGDGDKLDIVYKNSGVTAVSLLADAVTLVADTYVKVGFKFDGDKTMKFYADGVELTSARITARSTFTASAFPYDANLSPALVLVKNAAGSTPQTCTIDWVAFGFTNTPGDGFA